MRYFPVCLNISGRPCVVVGGGRVAERKVKALLDCGAGVTVISPELTPGLTALQKEGEVGWLDRLYRQGDLDGAFLVIAATDDEKVQRRVHAEAAERNLLLNVADVPDLCNFILPATVRHGDFSMSVSTAGKSPALAKALRRKLEKQFGPEYEVCLDILGSLRPVVLAQGWPQERNKRVFEQLLHEDLPVWAGNGDWEAIEAHIRLVMGDGVDLDRLRDIKERFSKGKAGSTER